ncbi:GPI-anchored protein LLG2 isoform X2 [Spinacia oleracea]|uniref:GPI-anchored protein LLG2 isoform X2 n=1 Tax=Spinacia oleracea TaxID=3562 RepID=A0ABM3RDR0_SPIOL|nr:GPI-anchored protein LLG2-like isoform X2 [Spinacia oleracea]
MATETDFKLSTILLFLFLLFAYASASDQMIQIIHPRLSTARTLLQAQKDCTVNFENLNYTIITSRCEGPNYPPNLCCEAFKDFACPYADELNDETNNCARTMFSYIKLHGQYPPGLFANECCNSNRCIECTDSQSSPHHDAPTPSAAVRHSLHWFLISIFLLFLLCGLFSF